MEYDKLDNITHIYHNNILENRYYYDNYNELIKEDSYVLNRTIEYIYDNLGNILSKKVYELGTTNLVAQDIYNYNNMNWKDQLTKFNGDIITYDEIGNPLTIGDSITLDWINGRQLNQYVDSNNTIKYQYNKDGIRTSKTINNVKTEYYLEGTSIIFEKTGNDVIYYIRNDVDDLIGFQYGNDKYYYIKNAQNDIIGILDSSNNVVARYTYDSIGNIISMIDGEGNNISKDDANIANINPYRYRSYYYDKETELYYLNSRYYNPLWGRFLNADGIINENKDIVGQNLYAYCSNDFINCFDSNGKGLLKNIWNTIKKVVSNVLKTDPEPKTSQANQIKASSNPMNGHNNVPTTGEPNTTVQKPNGDYRSYGPDGRATTDTDYSHPERHPDFPIPHEHNWTWNGDKPVRGKAHAPNDSETPSNSDTSKIVIGTVATVGAGYIVYRGIRMLLSLLPPFWWTIPINVATP